VITLAVTDAPTDADRDAVGAGLRAHNAQTVGPDGFARTPLGVLARDAAGGIVGGLIGYTQLRWLYVDLLHVDPDQRGAGIGAKLLEAAEAAALARGCVGVRLETYSFQAPDFYPKQGYTVLGALPDYPPGHTRYCLFKRLVQRPDGDSPCST